MTAGGLAGASAESAEAAAAHRRRNAAWRLAFDSAASRLRRNSAWRLAFDSCRAARGAPVGGPCGVQASIALTKRSKQRCRNFVRTEFPLVVDLGASLRSAWGCLASRLTLAVRREAHSLGTGVPRFARHGGASLRSAWRCLASLGGTGLPSARFTVRVRIFAFYGFRNDCSRIRSVMIAYASDFLSVARNFCKQATIRVRLALHFPPHTPYTKRYALL